MRVHKFKNRVKFNMMTFQSDFFCEMAQHYDDSQHDVAVLTARPKLKKPSLFAVVLLNDDETPMDLVVNILQEYFALDFERATEVMLSVHYKGRGIAGVYPKDIAQTKANQVMQHARAKGYPLQCQVEQYD